MRCRSEAPLSTASLSHSLNFCGTGVVSWLVWLMLTLPSRREGGTVLGNVVLTPSDPRRERAARVSGPPFVLPGLLLRDLGGGGLSDEPELVRIQVRRNRVREVVPDRRTCIRTSSDQRV